MIIRILKLSLIIASIVIIGIIIFLPRQTIEPVDPPPEAGKPIEVVKITAKEFLEQEVNKQGLSNRDFLILSDIVFCESSWSQYWKDGTPKVSNGNVGLFQINIGAHKIEYTELGLDPYNSEFDNIKYGIMLYKRNGIRDWKQWSGHCFIPLLKAKGIEL